MDIGDFPGGYDASGALAISEDGRICGVGTTFSNRVHQLYWDSVTGRIDLGTINNVPGFSYAYGVNSSGIVVGENWSNGAMLPSIWDQIGGMQALPGLPTGGGIASAVAINDLGQVAGSSLTANDYRAVLWLGKDSVEDLGVVGLDTSSRSNGIGPDGTVVGYSTGASEQAFVWTRSTGIIGIGQLQPGINCQAWDVNASGQVVGTSYGTPNRGFLWTSTGGFVDLGNGPGGWTNLVAYSINDAGTVVGTYTDDVGHKGFVWTASQGPVDLTSKLYSNGPGWTVFNAAAVNNKGWIAANAKTAAISRGHAVLLKPVYIVSPNTLGINLGSLKSGSVADLDADDGVAVQVCKAFVPNVSSPIIRATLTGNLPISTVTSLMLRVKTKMSSAGSFRQDLSLYDYAMGVYNDVRQDTLTTSYQTLDLTATIPANMTDGNGQVSARLEIRRTGFGSVAVPCVEIDAVHWHAED